MSVKNKVSFEKINGKEVFFYLSEPKGSRKIVIMSHGFRGSSEGPARTFVDFSKMLTQDGFAVLRFDHLNSGNSQGDYIDSSFDEWVETIKYFARKFLKKGYAVSLLGQSMGAAATMVASSDEELKDRISCIMLWVPDPEEDCTAKENQVYEEAGQKYRGSFFTEAKNADFFGCMEKYSGKIHLVYGEKDRYVSRELRAKTIEKAKSKGNSVMILKGQDHSPWEFDVAQEVYKEELKFLEDYS